MRRIKIIVAFFTLLSVICGQKFKEQSGVAYVLKLLFFEIVWYLLLISVGFFE